MITFLNWFEKKANKKLRLSQIKIAYQNTYAIAWLLPQYIDFLAMGNLEADEAVATLGSFQAYVDDMILQLTWKNVLPDSESMTLLEINNGLKSMYSGMTEGKRLARASLGKPKDDLVLFSDRFSPASGWSNFSENEWDILVSEVNRRTLGLL